MKSEQMSDMSSSSDLLVDRQGWNDYWSGKKKSGGIVYDIIAEFYRKVLIRPLLNRFIRQTFAKGASVLHAGCGSGQVDRDIRNDIAITALDISQNALEIYRRENGDRCRLLHGSIFSIPLPDSSMDGVYNLGVMEHFSEEDIGQILAEFKRVLRPHGQMVIFWPPEFGVSVLFFKALKFGLKVLTRRDFKFHPDEICRVRSREHVTRIFEAAGCRVKEYYFGPRDLFTYSVIVAET